MMPVTGIAGSYTAMPMGIIMVVCYMLSLVVFYGMIVPSHKNSEE